MQTKRMIWKNSTAAMLLTLFAFILVEKNTHSHNSGSRISGQHNQAVIHSGFDCLICEFQLAASAELPATPEISFALQANSSVTFVFHQHTISGTTSLPVERGPPAHA